MNYSVNLSSGQTVEVVIGEAAQINVEQALNYIESGRVEITKYVNEWAKPEITNYTKEYAEPIVTEIVNQTTKPLIDDYLNTTTKPQIDEYVTDNVKPYSDSAQDSAAKAKISEDNAKTSETNAKASELAAASSAGVASAAAVTATEAKDYTAKVLTDENLKTVGQDLQSADSNIKTVATNILNVNTVAKNIDNVNLLAPHTEAMEALAPDIMDVVTVAGITEQTKNVSDNMSAVVDVSNNKTNINNVSANITAVNNVSENMADVKKAVQSANDAKLWAVGTITEKPEGSSKYWAEQAKNAVQTPDATETVKGIVRLATSDEVTAGTNDSAAITPLKFKSKLDTKQDKSTAVNYDNISNCITYIPQDIKLELNNGTLTLKAGSKVYVPNEFENDGVTKKFDVVNITSDITVSSPYTNEPLFIYYRNNGIEQAANNAQCSGTSNTVVDGYWYDTTNNFIKRINAHEVAYSGLSFPLAIVNASNGSWTSIDQVFNGFGYIGSTIFALPGVKGLIPNSRNADGSLKSIEVVQNSVKIMTMASYMAGRKHCPLELFSNNELGGMEIDFNSWGVVATLKDLPRDKVYAAYYCLEDNFLHYFNNTGVESINKSLFAATFAVGDDNKITSFTPKTVFHALDYNDKSTISGWSMPSSRYIDLTLGASGATYTAPANGYFYFFSTSQGINLFNTQNEMRSYMTNTSGSAGFLPVKKGTTVIIYNTATDAVFRFIYAEGESYNPVSSSNSGGHEVIGPSEGGDEHLEIPDY